MQKMLGYDDSWMFSQSRIKELIDWMAFNATFNIISVISRRQLTLFMSFLGFTSTRLGLQSVLPKDIPAKNPEDQVRLEPLAPGLQVKLFTNEPHKIPWAKEEKQNVLHIFQS